MSNFTLPQIKKLIIISENKRENKESAPLKKTDLSQVHLLRGVAALAVTIFHLYCGNPALFPISQIKSVLSYGYLGVEVFFFLSGFIICYSLPITYKLTKDFKAFILKRIIRIEPPYILSITVLIIVGLIAENYNSAPFVFEWKNILLHLGYLNNFGLGEYLNVVYWTLGIEFQFYLIVALIFPLLISERKVTIYSIFAAIGCASFFRIENTQLIFPYLPIFAVGILYYLHQYARKIKNGEYIGLTISFLFLIWLHLDLPALLSSLFGLIVIRTKVPKTSIISFLSMISFSLYLTHVFIGGRVINLGLRFVNNEFHRYLLFSFALGLSILGAYVFYRMIEKPAMGWSKKIKY